MIGNLSKSKGFKGDKGDALTYEMLTPEQREALKGKQGEKGDTPVIRFRYDQATGNLYYISDGILLDKEYIGSNNLVTKDIIDLAKYYGNINITPSDSSLFSFSTNDETMTASVAASTHDISGNIVIPYKYSINDKEYLITSIAISAFYNCEELTSITIPNCVTNIGKRAFICRNLTDVYFNGTPEQWNAIHIGEENFDIEYATIHYTKPDVTKQYVDFSIENAREYTDIKKSEVQKAVSAVDDKVSQIKGTIVDIINDVAELQGETSDMSNAVSTINTELSKVKNNVSYLDRDVSYVKADILKINDEIEGINQSIEEVKDDISGFNNNILEHSNDIDTLYKRDEIVLSEAKSYADENSTNTFVALKSYIDSEIQKVVEYSDQKDTETLPTWSFVNILGGAENWTEEEVLDSNNNVIGSRYGQVVNVNNAIITPNSMVDLRITSEQMVKFYEKHLAFSATNKDGVVTIYCVGSIPDDDYTIQATVTEVVIDE